MTHPNVFPLFNSRLRPFSRAHQMGPLGPDRKLFITRLASGAHGGANGLVPLLLASPHGPDTAIRIALGQRHAEECEMRKTLSGGFWTVSAAPGLTRIVIVGLVAAIPTTSAPILAPHPPQQLSSYLRGVSLWFRFSTHPSFETYVADQGRKVS